MKGQTTLEIDRLLTKSQHRLAQAKAAVKQNGPRSPPPIANLAQRLKEAHAALKSQFRFAGDAATTELFLSHCTGPTDLWENP